MLSINERSSGICLRRSGPIGDSASDRVALLLRAGFELSVEQGLLQPRERVTRQEVADLDETISVELLAPLGGHIHAPAGGDETRRHGGQASTGGRGARGG